MFLIHDADAWSSLTTKQHPSRRELIVQGQVADPTAFQYFALTANDAYASTVDNVCGAALIHSDILLTAAHCQGLFNYGAWMFNPTTKQFDRMMKIVEQWRHPNFNLMNNSYYNWDLLVMRLEEPVLDIQPVALNNDPQVPSIDEVLKAIGFGAREYGEELSTSLLVGELQYMSPQLCENKILTVPIQGAAVGEELLCAGSTEAGNSICLGDSGGPLVSNDGILVGITSWTLQCKVDALPDGFARISAMYDWVQEKICQISTDAPPSCPAPDLTPAADMVQIRLDFLHDFSPEDTTFAVRNQASGAIEYAGPTYVVPDRDSSSIWSSSFQLVEGRYTFEVYDRELNGLSDPLDQRKGEWQLYARGSTAFDLVASGDYAFSKESITSFQITLPAFLSPIMEPTSAPITLSPAGLPSTMSPTSQEAASPPTGMIAEAHKAQKYVPLLLTSTFLPPVTAVPTPNTTESSVQAGDLARTASDKSGPGKAIAIVFSLLFFVLCAVAVYFRSRLVALFASKRSSSEPTTDTGDEESTPKQSAQAPGPDGLSVQYTASLASGSG